MILLIDDLIHFYIIIFIDFIFDSWTVKMCHYKYHYNDSKTTYYVLL